MVSICICSSSNTSFESRNFDSSIFSAAAFAVAEQTLLHTPRRNMSPWRKWRCKLSQRGQLGEGRRGKRNKQQKQKQLRTCKSSANLAFCVPRLRFNASRLGVVVVVVCCAGQQLQFHFRSLAFYSLFWPARRVCSRRFVYFRYFRLFSRNKYFRLSLSISFCFSFCFCSVLFFIQLAAAQTFAQIRWNSCINFVPSRYLIETEQRNAVALAAE